MTGPLDLIRKALTISNVEPQSRYGVESVLQSISCEFDVEPTPQAWTAALGLLVDRIQELDVALRKKRHRLAQVRDNHDTDGRALLQAKRSLDDIRQRLGGHPDSVLTGENGLAAATMRENERLRDAVTRVIGWARHITKHPGMKNDHAAAKAVMIILRGFDDPSASNADDRPPSNT